MNRGIKSYLFNSETNKHINQIKNIDRVYSWEEIYSKSKALLVQIGGNLMKLYELTVHEIVEKLQSGEIT